MCTTSRNRMTEGRAFSDPTPMDTEPEPLIRKTPERAQDQRVTENSRLTGSEPESFHFQP